LVKRKSVIEDLINTVDMIEDTIQPTKNTFLDDIVSQHDIIGTAKINTIREEASRAADALGFPTTRDEYWKYTRVGKITREKFEVSQQTFKADAGAYRFNSESHINLFFVNGFYDANLSDSIIDTDDFKVMPLSLAIEKYPELVDQYFAEKLPYSCEVFTAINVAAFTDGVFVHVAKNKTLDKTIHLINLTIGNRVIAQPHHLIVAERSSKVNLVHSFESVESTGSFTNSVSEFYVAENAEINYEKLQAEDSSSFHISNEKVYQEANSRFHINTFTLNGALVRNNLNIDADGENCLTNLYGLYLLQDNQHVDNHTFIDHLKAHCESNEMYKGIIDGKGTAVFNGKVMVRKDSQKINAFQSNANILLTDDATINSKPELEIYADDVKCSHGSTVGQLDQDALFYLRARGIGETEAMKLLMVAFASEVLDETKDELFAEKVKSLLDKQFGMLVV
jgi:Fe-S cluster assembly protein SufD